MSLCWPHDLLINFSTSCPFDPKNDKYIFFAPPFLNEIKSVWVPSRNVATEREKYIKKSLLSLI